MIKLTSFLIWLFNTPLLMDIFDTSHEGVIFRDFFVMKPLTIAMFIVSFIMVLLMKLYEHNCHKFNQFLITLCSGWLILSIAVIASLIGLSSYLEINKVFDIYLITDNDPYEAKRHMPAVMTLLGFFFMALAGGIFVFNTKRSIKRLKIISWTLLTLGGLTIIGHLFVPIPLFYYTTFGGDGMALNTAILFVLLGHFLRRISGCIKDNYKYKH